MAKVLPHHPDIVSNLVLGVFQNPHSSNFQGIVIYDGVCGIGKTTRIINEINDSYKANPLNRFIYVGLYLDELHRIAGTTPDIALNSKPPIRDTTGAIIYDPNRKIHIDFLHAENKPTKLKNLKDHIKNNRNIVITHQLLSMFDAECLDLLRVRNYHVIIDEEPTVLESTNERYKITFQNSTKELNLYKEEINDLIKLGQITVNGSNVTWTGEDLKRYGDLRKDIENNNIVVVNNTNSKPRILLWRQNPEVFQVFKTVHILTYLYKNSILQAYFDICKVPYLIKDITKEEVLDDRLMKPYHRLLHINKLRERDLTLPTYPGRVLSTKWLKHFALDYSPSSNNDIKTKLNTYFKTAVPTRTKAPTAKEKMWTTLKKAKSSLKGKGYDSRFIPFNIKATNDHRAVNKMAFVYNVFPNPILIRFVQQEGITYSLDERYALTTLLQWMYRSSLRDGQVVELMLPSDRMRSLLELWIEDIKDLYEFTRRVRDQSIKKDKDLEDYQDIILPVTFNDFYKVQPGLVNYVL